MSDNASAWVFGNLLAGLAEAHRKGQKLCPYEYARVLIRETQELDFSPGSMEIEDDLDTLGLRRVRGGEVQYKWPDKWEDA